MLIFFVLFCFVLFCFVFVFVFCFLFFVLFLFCFVLFLFVCLFFFLFFSSFFFPYRKLKNAVENIFNVKIIKCIWQIISTHSMCVVIHITCKKHLPFCCMLIFFLVSFLPATGKKKLHLEAGEHNFPFQFQLPTTSPLPPPFEGEFGQIRYKVQAEIKRPWKSSHVTEKYFNVTGPVVDLNYIPGITVSCRCMH